ncbi:type I polyketide synthase, partial [Cellulomonas phragmiteti]
MTAAPTGTAVIGAALRLPGAGTLAEYWENLRGGRDCITRRQVDELRGLVDDALLDDARWVGASGRIDGVYGFDPATFGMAPRTALVTDPQHRLLLTIVHEALDDAGVVPAPGDRIAVFAGVGRNRHEELVRAVLRATGEPVDEVELEIGNEKDHSSTKVAYRLDLGGPAVTVQTACSTGLVAVHQACQSLASYECDVAVVAAAAVRVPDVHGYLHLPGSIGSADGVCRPFSARASGAVAGDGVVGVVLRRTEDAVAAGDHVRAVIRGSAVNNDGRKSGYASVSARAQEAVIRDALLFAEVDAASIGSVEAHGSGTPLGDATEWSALAAVYGTQGTTLVGSVKSGLGHLREASGLAGLVRVVASLEHASVPPTINVGAVAPFARERSALALSRTVQDWPLPGTRRAAVSSFGLGGTNAHVVLEQAPAVVDSVDRDGGGSIVLVSGRTAAAAEETARRWASALRDGVPVPTASRVSQQRRRHLAHRRFAVGEDPQAVADDLLVDPGASDRPTDGVCFVFPGIGDHYTSMAAGLRTLLPGFAAEVDRLLAACGAHADRDLAAWLSTTPSTGRGAAVDVRRLVSRRDDVRPASVDTVAVHAAVFSVQVALARALGRLGLHPDVVVGHSLGELSAATVAGVLDEADAVELLVTRARLLEAAEPGAMLALTTSEPPESHLRPGVWLAAVNSPRSCVVAGEPDAVRALADELAEQGAAGRLVPVTQAMHTPLMATAARGLDDVLARLRLRAPQVPLASNVTGTWAGEELTHPGYWQQHLTSTVLFGPALRTATERAGVLLEIGPGQLRTLAVQAQRDLGGAVVVPTVRREYQNERDDAVLLRALGQLWRRGLAPDWGALDLPEPGPVVPLPPTALDARELRVDADLEGLDLDGAVGTGTVVPRARPAAPAPAAA